MSIVAHFARSVRAICSRRRVCDAAPFRSAIPHGACGAARALRRASVHNARTCQSITETRAAVERQPAPPIPTEAFNQLHDGPHHQHSTVNRWRTNENAWNWKLSTSHTYQARHVHHSHTHAHTPDGHCVLRARVCVLRARPQQREREPSSGDVWSWRTFFQQNCAMYSIGWCAEPENHFAHTRRVHSARRVWRTRTMDAYTYLCELLHSYI